MLNIVKYFTIILCSICMIAAICLGIAGLVEAPVDTDAVLIAGIILAGYACIVALLYFSVKRKYVPGYWVAMALSILPIIIICIVLWLAIQADEIIG